MPVVSEKYGLAYYPVPKIASSSLKHAFYFLEHGDWYRKQGQPDGTLGNIHELSFGDPHFSAETLARHAHLESIVVIRDPIKRLLSAYANRVLYHGDLNAWRARKDGISFRHGPRPDLATFIAHLEDYQRESAAIRHHTVPVRAFLGPDLSRYSHVFRIEEMDSLMALLRNRTGQTLALPHEQAGGPKISPDVLSAAQHEKLRTFYARDYELMQDLYA
ncbi:MAG: hypothetical protein EP335_10550 [Alphaproteobacteria bacterium]|nr:MAG: hypothetical protein EP335_10550 [Alphaproteobacteria bacterium]